MKNNLNNGHVVKKYRVLNLEKNELKVIDK